MAPRYRRELWLAMANQLNVEFWCDTREQQGIKTLDLINEAIPHQQIRNFSFRGILIWQRGAVGRLLIKKKAIEAVIVLGEANCLSNWLILLLCKILNIPSCVWTHGLYGSESTLKRWLRVSLYKLGTHVLTYERRARQLLIEQGIREDKLSVIYNSLHYSNHLAIRAKLQPDKARVLNFFKNPEANCLFFIGRLTSNKQLDLLAKALGNLPDSFNLLFIGDGPMLAELKSLLKSETQEGRVYFTGALYEEAEIAPLIFNSDLCVSPGNVGLTCIHSLSYGTPVCTHNDFNYQMPEAEAIEDGFNGFFFERGNAESLAQNILQWFVKHQNRKLTRKHAYQIVDEAYNPLKQLDTFKQVLNRLKSTSI